MSKAKLVNTKILCRVIGQLLIIEGIMMAICLGVGLLYKEQDHTPFAAGLAVTIIAIIILKSIGKDAHNTINRRESYLVVALTWVIFSILSTIPFMIDGHCKTIGTAFFESVSGFSSSGASVINNIEELPHSLLFWRVLTNWIGGLGIVFFTMTILPIAGRGDVKLFAAESIGLAHEKLHPKIKTTAAWIWSIYIFLTVSCAISLNLAGINLFDSICHALSTVSTGGFSTHSQDIAFYNSPLVEYILIVFMFLGGVNFFMLYTMGTKKTLSPLKHSSEQKFYLITIVLISLICATGLYFYNGYDIERSLRTAFFNCISISTTTGFTTDNYQNWFHPITPLIMFLMFTGANSGSTTGGFKSIRMLIIMKVTLIQFKRTLHPNAVIPVQIDRTPISHDTERNVLTLLFWFLFMILIGTIALMCIGINGFDSFNIALSSLCNIGTNFGHIFGPDQGVAGLPETGKWICSFLMLAGRLEVFALLLPFTSTFWHKQ